MNKEMQKIENAKVSVIIPAYNVEKYIEDCLNSLIHQSLYEIEIICIDDGSTDSTRDILKKYGELDKRIVVIYCSENKGQACARNRGLEVARGKYIYFVDADDMVKKDALKCLVNIMETEDLDGTLFAASGISEGGYEQYQVDVERKKTAGVSCSGQDMVAKLVENNEWSSGVWVQFWRRSYLEMNKLSFREDTSPYEDILFSIQAIFSAKRIRCISEKFYIYRKRKNAVTTTKINIKKATAISISCIEAIRFLEQNQEKLSRENMKAIGRYCARYRAFAWDSFQELAQQGFDMEKIIFKDKTHEVFFHCYILGHYSHIPDFLSLDMWNRIKSEKHIIVYGAGRVGTEVMEQLANYGIHNFFVAVSDKKNLGKCATGRRIYQLSELRDYKNNCVILLSAAERHKKDMIQNLQDNGFCNYVLMYGN